MMNCIIVDDERPAIRLLESYVKKLPFLNLLGGCESGTEALEILNSRPVDLVFLDIQMPDLTGLELIKTLTTKPQVILVTAYPDHAVEGFELEVTDYLVKPVSFERFVKSINRAKALRSNKEEVSIPESDHLFLKADYKFVKVNFSEILYIKGMGAYVDVRTEKDRHIVHQSMKTMAEKLPERVFFRVHKSYLINLEKVTSVYGNTIEVREEKIPLGKSYREAFYAKIESL